MSGNRHVGSNPTLSANLRQALASLAASVGKPCLASVARRLPSGAAAAAKEGGEFYLLFAAATDHFLRARVATNCLSAKMQPLQVAESLLTFDCGLLSKAVRLHSPKRAQSGAKVHWIGHQRSRAVEGSQRGPKSIDCSLETLDHRCVHRVSNRANGGQIREVPEVWLGSHVCQSPLLRSADWRFVRITEQRVERRERRDVSQALAVLGGG